jgi:hypothetical protein
MMAKNVDGGNVKFSFKGDTSSLNSELNKASANLSGLSKAAQGTANSMTRNLTRAAKNTEVSLNGVKNQSGALTGALTTLGHALHSIAMPRSGLSILSGRMMEMGSAGSGLVRILGRLNPIVLSAAVIAGGLAAAYHMLKKDTEAQEEATRKLKEQQLELNKAFSAMEDTTNDLDLELAILEGTLTRADVAQVKFAENLRAKALPTQELMAKQIGKLVHEESRLQKLVEGSSRGRLENTVALADTRKELAALIKQETAFNDRLTDNITKSNTMSNSTRENTTANRENKKSVEDLTDAWENNTDGFADDIPYLMALNQRAYEEKIAQEEMVLSVLEERQRREVAIAEAISKAEEDAFQARMKNASNFAGALTDLSINLNSRLTEDSEEETMKSFRIAQVGALAEIAINTALAATAAMKKTGNPVSAAPAILFGGLQAAAVVAEPPPTFHTGGMIGPDERTIKAQTGEGILSRSGVEAAGGEAGVNALNAGGSGQTIVVQQVWKHKIFDAFIIENLRRSGSPLATAIRTSGATRGILI